MKRTQISKIRTPPTETTVVVGIMKYEKCISKYNERQRVWGRGGGGERIVANGGERCKKGMATMQSRLRSTPNHNHQSSVTETFSSQLDGYQSSPAQMTTGRARTTPISPMALQTSDRVARGPSARGLAAGTTVGSAACA
jgi:hypothetical protein